MSGYVKLFSDILDSSIWNEPKHTRLVWVTLLALSNADGYVRGSPQWLASKAKVTVPECEEALTTLLAPDPVSRTPDNDGRRIEKLADGWLVLNYIAFRNRLSSDPQAVAVRERVRKHRERYNTLRNVTGVTKATPASASVHASVSVQGIGVRGRGSEPVNGARLIVHERELERVRQAIRDIKASYSEHQNVTAEDRKKLVTLNNRAKELREIIGVQV